MKKNLGLEIFINFIITFSVGILTFVINKYFSIYLGMENLGLMKLFTQILSYLNLAEIGLAAAAAYALYKPLLEKNYEKISIIMNTISKLYKKISIFILITGLLLNPVIPFFIKDKVSNIIYLYWTLYIIGFSFSYCFIKYSILLTADQKFILVRIFQGGSKILCQLLQLVVIIKLQSFLIFIILTIIENLIQYIIYKIYYKKYYNYLFETKEKDSSITQNLKYLFYHKLAETIGYNMEIIIMSKFISLKIVAIYGSYQIIIQTILNILSIVLNTIRPKIGKFIAENDKERIFEYWKSLEVLFLQVSLIFSYCSYILINKFILLWLGKDFILPKNTIVLILIILFIKCFRMIMNIFKDGFGFFDDIYLPISATLINFILSIILVHYFGLNGIIVGSIISNVLTICIVRPILVIKRCFGKGINDYIKIYGNYIILITFSLIACNYTLNFLPKKEVRTWIDFLVYAVMIGTMTSIITLFIFFTNKNFRNVLKVKTFLANNIDKKV